MKKRQSILLNRISSAVLLVTVVVLFSMQLQRDDSEANVPEITATEAPAPAEPTVQPIKLQGYLKDLLPFNTEQVEQITIEAYGIEQAIPVPEERQQVILHNLNDLDLTKAAAEYTPKPLEPTYMRFHTADHVYTLSYDLRENEFIIDSKGFYADDEVMLLMYGLLQPDSKLAELDQMFEQARIELEQYEGDIVGSLIYPEDQLSLFSLNYEAWVGLLFNMSSLKSTEIGHYYKEGQQAVNIAVEYENGILAINQSLIFTQEGYATPSGITIGTAEEQVLAGLGEPSLKLPSKWSYATGDDLKFHLYMEHNKVKYIVLTEPL